MPPRLLERITGRESAQFNTMRRRFSAHFNLFSALKTAHFKSWREKAAHGAFDRSELKQNDREEKKQRTVRPDGRTVLFLAAGEGFERSAPAGAERAD